jgi:hypothetical protein
MGFSTGSRNEQDESFWKKRRGLLGCELTPKNKNHVHPVKGTVHFTLFVRSWGISASSGQKVTRRPPISLS